jgi:hypothetical protein
MTPIAIASKDKEQLFVETIHLAKLLKGRSVPYLLPFEFAAGFRKLKAYCLAGLPLRFLRLFSSHTALSQESPLHGMGLPSGMLSRLVGSLLSHASSGEDLSRGSRTGCLVCVGIVTPYLVRRRRKINLVASGLFETSTPLGVITDAENSLLFARGCCQGGFRILIERRSRLLYALAQKEDKCWIKTNGPSRIEAVDLVMI